MHRREDNSDKKEVQLSTELSIFYVITSATLKA